MEAKLTGLTQQNSDTTAPSGRELYHLQFSLQAASPETFRYTLVQGHPLLLPIVGGMVHWVTETQSNVKQRN
jgi:hypothetical protein